VTTPTALIDAGIDLNSGFIVLMEATTTSFGDFISRPKSSEIFISSPERALRTKSIPQTGQLPGLSEITVGCMEHV
jgi:hypothetical protein